LDGIRKHLLSHAHINFTDKIVMQLHTTCSLQEMAGILLGFYRVNLIDEHTEICDIGVIPTEIRMA
jgi:galactokinase